MSQTQINKRFATTKLTCVYAHVGLFDVADRQVWIARKRFGIVPEHVAHARMIKGGSNSASVADKDRFLCFWFNPPRSGDGLVHGQAIDWAEGHLMVRLDPNWNYTTQQLIRATDTARIDRNLDQQYRWGRAIFEAYRQLAPDFPVNWHMIGPRPKDSMFHIVRHPGSSAAQAERDTDEGWATS